MEPIFKCLVCYSRLVIPTTTTTNQETVRNNKPNGKIPLADFSLKIQYFKPSLCFTEK